MSDPLSSAEGREVLYRSLVAGMSEGMVVESASRGIVSCNEAAERILGLTAQRMAGRSAPDLRYLTYHEDGTLFPPHDHPTMRVMRTGVPETGVVMRIDRPDGTRSWIRINARPVDPVPPGQAPEAVVTTFVDITAERETLDELRATEQRYQTLVETLPLVTYVDPVEWDQPDAFISPQVEAMLGYSPQEWVEREVSLFPELLDPRDRDRVKAWYDATSAPSSEVARLTYRMRARDGRTVWVEDASKNVIDPVSGEFTAIGYLRDVTAEVDTQRRLRSAHSRFSGLIANLGAPILVEDEQGLVFLANDEFCTTFGFAPPARALVGRALTDVVDEAIGQAIDPAGSRGIIEALRASGERRLGIHAGLTDGRVFSCDFVPTVSDGVARGALWVFRDITERTTFQRELAVARDEALAASRAKTDFLATMSHEIRTPMNGIVATIELLEEHALDTEATELVRIVRDAAQSLQSILDDVLDFSKVESGTQTLDPVPFDLGATVRGVAELLAPAGARKGVTVRAQVDPIMPAAVTGDQGMVRQVLLNLAGNAVKFTDAGEVAIVVELLECDDDTVRTALTVRDTGPGISPEATAHLFDPFYQADSSAHRQHGGTGLGLAITDRLVRLMDGTIQLASTVGAGTAFTVTLPFAPADAGSDVATPVAAPALAPDEALHGVVLLVEDNAANRAVGLRQLRRLGLEAHARESGDEAVRAVANGGWDCVLMDCQMPGMDGFAATRAIRAAEEAAGAERTPIVAMTANAMQGDREACLAAGMDDYLAKPVRLAPLRNMLARWLGDGSGADRVDGRASTSPTLTSQTPDGALDASVIAELREETGEDFAALVSLYTNQLGPRRAALSDAVDAGDMAAAQAAAHSLRGASGTYGAVRLARRCQAFEDAAREDRTLELPALLAALDAEAEAVARAFALETEVDDPSSTS